MWITMRQIDLIDLSRGMQLILKPIVTHTWWCFRCSQKSLCG